MYKYLIWGFILIIISITASAQVDLSIEDIKCLNSTGVQFKITNKGDETASTKDFIVKSNFFSAASVNVDAKGVDKGYKFNIPGNFTSEKIYPIRDQVEPVFFTSEKNIFTYPATYKVYLEYQGCKESYGECRAISEVTCLGTQNYGCKAIPVEIDSCQNTEKEVLLKFHNVNKGLYIKVDPLKDLRYTFFGKKYHIQNDLPNRTSVKEIGEDIYLLRFDQIPGNSIERVKIFTNICGYEDYANCEFIETNKTVNETRPIVSPLNESYNFTSTSGSSSDKIIYIISVIFVAIIVFIIYNVKKVRI